MNAFEAPRAVEGVDETFEGPLTPVMLRFEKTPERSASQSCRNYLWKNAR